MRPGTGSPCAVAADPVTNLFAMAPTVKMASMTGMRASGNSSSIFGDMVSKREKQITHRPLIKRSYFRPGKGTVPLWYGPGVALGGMGDIAGRSNSNQEV